jgi:NAD(P)H-hydrate epimerase
MDKAGKEVAQKIETFVQRELTPRQVVFLAGKGNNGGDGYVAARELLKKGFIVHVLTPYPKNQWGPLCSMQAKQFETAGGKIEPLFSNTPVPTEGVIVDALVGTGFVGEAKEELELAIAFANRAALPIIAIDIPSGLCGATGNVGSIAINAKMTIYLEFPKIGFFIGEGYKHVGELVHASFGLPISYQEKVIAEAFLVGSEEMKKKLPSMEKMRNKYSAGYVLTLAGSDTMKGAGALASFAALRTGAGIVRWFYLGLDSKSCLVPLEVLACSIQEHESLFFDEMRRAKALLIGPGLGRTKEATKYISKALSRATMPTVIDADALFFLSKYPRESIPSHALLTPHMGELKRLLQAHHLEGNFLSSCQALVEKTKAMMLVKGAPNFLFRKGQIPYILPFGNPGMATAGSGDVLSGMLASLLAQQLSLEDAAVLGSYLHGLSGDLSALDKTQYSLVASDLIEYLPKAFAKVMHLYKGIP